jgi:hypothetical protein
MAVIELENSYISLDDANTYFANRLYTDPWDNASSDESEKEYALIWACSLLENRVHWKGLKTTLSQTLQWPRKGLVNLYGQSVDKTIIPASIKAVQCELALYLLQNNPMTVNNGIERLDLDGLLINVSNTNQTIPNKIFQIVAHWGNLLDSPGTVRLTR